MSRVTVTRSTPRFAGVCAVLALLLVSAGCVQTTVRTEVGPNGSVESYSVNVTTSEQVMGFLNGSAQEEGFDSFGDRLRKNLTEDAGLRAENVSIDRKRVRNGNVSRIVTLENVTLTERARENVTVRRFENGTVLFRDLSFREDGDENGTDDGTNDSSDLEPGSGTLPPRTDYYTTMPGPVASSNADFVNGSTAHWVAEGDNESIGPVRVRSEVRTDPAARFDADGNGRVGFGEVLGAIAAFNSGSTVDGDPVTFRGVLEAIAAFNEGRSV